DRNYTLTYTAASSGQHITISWVATSGTGNVTLNGAALSSGSGALGALTVSGTSANTTASVTAEGPTDWVHWGDASLNRKAGVTAQISNYSIVGSGGVQSYQNDPRALSWIDGTPAATGTNHNGIFISLPGNGFS